MNDAGNPELAARAIAHGRVQGVFYRDTVRRAAFEHGVCGSAFNRPDGSVEMLLEGSRTAVDAVLDIAREGSSASVVDSVSVEWIEPTGAQSFTVG